MQITRSERKKELCLKYIDVQSCSKSRDMRTNRQGCMRERDGSFSSPPKIKDRQTNEKGENLGSFL